MPVSSLLEALNEGNKRTEPETFEASLLPICHVPSGVQLLAALCAWKHAACCAAFHCLESLWACCLSLSLEPLSMLPFTVLRAFGHAALHCISMS